MANSKCITNIMCVFDANKADIEKTSDESTHGNMPFITLPLGNSLAPYLVSLLCPRLELKHCPDLSMIQSRLWSPSFVNSQDLRSNNRSWTLDTEHVRINSSPSTFHTQFPGRYIAHTIWEALPVNDVCRSTSKSHFGSTKAFTSIGSRKSRRVSVATNARPRCRTSTNFCIFFVIDLWWVEGASCSSVCLVHTKLWNVESLRLVVEKASHLTCTS